MFGRRKFLGSIGAAGIVSLAGCSNDQDQGNDRSPAAEAVANYYDAIVAGELERAAGLLALTQFEEEGGTVEQVANILRERGIDESGTDSTVGEFNELSVSEFAEYTFRTEDGEEAEFTEQEITEFTSTGGDFGADEDQLSLVRHTGGFVPEVWVPYQPEQEPADGWGEVVIEVATFDGEALLVGDFRTFTDYKVIA